MWTKVDLKLFSGPKEKPFDLLSLLSIVKWMRNKSNIEINSQEETQMQNSKDSKAKNFFF